MGRVLEEVGEAGVWLWVWGEVELEWVLGEEDALGLLLLGQLGESGLLLLGELGLGLMLVSG